MKELLARDIMSRDVVTVPDDLPVAELGRLLAERHISGAPVVNRKNRVVGVVSAMDIVANELKVGHKVVPESEYYSRPDIGTPAEMGRLGIHIEEYADALVRDIMTPLVITAPPEATVSQVAEIMGVNRIHRVLVVDGDELAGVVSTLDLIGHVRPGAEAPAPGPVSARRVLWATDLGPSSSRVGERALQLAREINARLTVLHVTPDLGALWRSYGDRPEVVDLQQRLEEQAMDRLNDLVKSLQRTVPELEVIGRSGDPARVILTVVEEMKPTYLVVGSQRPDAERITGIGSVAEKLLLLSPSPVLTVPRCD